MGDLQKSGCPGCGGKIDYGTGDCIECGRSPIEYFRAKAGAELRDRFAMAALTGLLIVQKDVNFKLHPDGVSKQAYELAGTMLAEREKKA